MRMTAISMCSLTWGDDSYDDGFIEGSKVYSMWRILYCILRCNSK